MYAEATVPSYLNYNSWTVLSLNNQVESHLPEEIFLPVETQCGVIFKIGHKQNRVASQYLNDSCHSLWPMLKATNLGLQIHYKSLCLQEQVLPSTE